MNQDHLFPYRLSRRDFLKTTAGACAALAAAPLAARAADPVKIGSGKWTYTLDPSWGKLPDGMSYGLGCGIAVDSSIAMRGRQARDRMDSRMRDRIRDWRHPREERPR